MFENVDIHTYTRTPEAYLYFKLNNEPKGSGELINNKQTNFLLYAQITKRYICTEALAGHLKLKYYNLLFIY